MSIFAVSEEGSSEGWLSSIQTPVDYRSDGEATVEQNRRSATAADVRVTIEGAEKREESV